LCEGKIYDGKVKIERRVKPESSLSVPDHWLERDSQTLLPEKVTHQAPMYIKPRMDFKMYPVLVVSASYEKDEEVPDVCGMVVKKALTNKRECFVFVPPFEYDRSNTWQIRLIEWVLSLVKTASRSSIYYSMRNKMQNLHTIVDNLKVSERPIQSYMCEGVTMMEDYNDSECEFEVEFNPEDEIVKWSGKLHSVKTIVKQMKV